MKANGGQRARKDPARQALGLAVSMLGIGATLLVLSLALGSSPSPSLKPVSQGLRVLVPYAGLIGFALLVVYLAIRRKPEDPASSRLEPALFGKETTGFESQLDSRPADPAPAAGPVHRGLLPQATAWNAQVLRDIEWRRFEAVCAGLFGQAGFAARSQSHGADGGVDIWLYSENAEGPAAVVRCKHWLDKPVGVKEMREFYSVMSSHKLRRGTVATSGTFTAEARDFAKSNGISTLDGLGLLALVSRRTSEQQKQLLRIAYEGEYWRPTCASCGLKMVERSTRKNSGLFWGCADHPRCLFTLPVRTAA